jgi:hemerythrin superfamily protein
MKATELLKMQHREVDALLGKLETGGTEDELLQLADVLSAHSLAEQELVYSVLRSRQPEVILEALEEHACSKYELERLLDADLLSDELQAKAAVLRELVKHHAEEEEEVILPQLESALSSAELKTLGDRLELRFDELVALGHEAVLIQLSDVDADEQGVGRLSSVRAFLDLEGA